MSHPLHYSYHTSIPTQNQFVPFHQPLSISHYHQRQQQQLIPAPSTASYHYPAILPPYHVRYPAIPLQALPHSIPISHHFIHQQSNNKRDNDLGRGYDDETRLFTPSIIVPINPIRNIHVSAAAKESNYNQITLVSPPTNKTVFQKPEFEKEENMIIGEVAERLAKRHRSDMYQSPFPAVNSGETAVGIEPKLNNITTSKTNTQKSPKSLSDKTKTDHQNVNESMISADSKLKKRGMKTACEFCTRRKIKCIKSDDDSLSCYFCLERGVECVFVKHKKRGRPRVHYLILDTLKEELQKEKEALELVEQTKNKNLQHE